MPVSVIVGGQFGSEGKGKVAHWLAKRREASVVVRVGGSNSGHTAIDDTGKLRIFRHLPTACLLPDPTLVIGPGSYVDVPVLLEEIKNTHLEAGRLIVSPNAVVISGDHKQEEREWGLLSRIGSTGSGTGAAVVERLRRSRREIFASNDRRLQRLLGDTTDYMRKALRRGERVVIEGTQGFGLSVLHSPDYPYVTSRDTSAAAFVSEAGLSPLDVDEVVLVIRAFPIRVAGLSGPLPNEIGWGDIPQNRKGQYVQEYTSVTREIRRVAKFDPEVVRSAIRVNSPTAIILNHLDYLNLTSKGGGWRTAAAEKFLREVEEQIGMSVGFVGRGPDCIDVV